MKKIFNKFKELFRLPGDPKYIAKGFGLGSFIGMMPIPGLQVFVALFFASIFKVHKTAAAIGVFNTNLATGIFIFGFNFWLGKKILGIQSSFQLPNKLNLDFIKTIFNAGSEVFLAMVAGGIITGIVSYFFGYYLVLKVYKLRQKKESL